MKSANNISRISLLSFALAIALAFAVRSIAAQAPHEKHEAKHPGYMAHIKTQAAAEALKPGDSTAMVCGMCKYVMVYKVSNDQAHVKMMTIGRKHTCPGCGGAVEVVGTSIGEGKNEEVKHVCSKCGDDAMFVCASKPGGGAADDHKQHEK